MIWLIGAGLMAKEYIKVLQSIGEKFLVIGRSEDRAKQLEQEFKCSVYSGGLENFLRTKPALPEKAIVAVGIEVLQAVTIRLLEYGVKDILLEKPGIAYPSEMKELSKVVREKKANVLLAYNRRFYASVLKARELIEADGGPTSCLFEFTEWSHVIGPMKKDPAEHRNWFLGNSTHVIDTAFYLCGTPVEMCTFTAGALEWHPSSSIFSGAGKTDKNVLFSYVANWEAPGRWSLEVMTRKNRYIFKPMEKLQRMKLGSVAIEPVEDMSYELDEKFKPGLYLQTKAFLDNEYSELLTMEQQEKMLVFYRRMANY